MMARFIRYYIFLSLALIVTSCGQSEAEKKRLTRAQQEELSRQEKAALKIATTPTMDCLPLFIAAEDSLFKVAGIDVRLKMRNSQLDGDTLIAGNYVEGLVTDLIRAERLQKEGTHLRYVAATNAYWQVVSNRLSRVRELKQLSDKMIAITRFSVTEYLADLAIDSVKPKEDVFRIQINDVHIRLKMLLNNEMDAVILTEPQATTARLYNNPMLVDSRDKNFNFGVIAFSTRCFADPIRKKQLAGFIKVYNSVCDSINEKGVQHFAAVIKKYMGADDKTIAKLPRLQYKHAAAPREQDVERAKKRWK